jgi:hypothetical protein
MKKVTFKDVEPEPMSSPGPWEMILDGMESEQSFTHYVNPLADGSSDAGQETPVESKLVRSVIPLHMQTPEAVQVLNKISLQRGPLGKVDQNSMDYYLRTGPKKLSPEPMMNVEMPVPRGQNKRIASKSSNRFETGVEPTEGRKAPESSEDENVVLDGKLEEEVECSGVRPNANNNVPVVLKSPIFQYGSAKVAGNPEGENSDLDEIPATFNPRETREVSTRVSSPVHCSLSQYSAPEDEMNEKGTREASIEKPDSFSFGMGGSDEATAQFVEEQPDKELALDAEESVDQPNPFTSIIERLREDPKRLRSPVLGAMPETVQSPQSPESPENCTPMNLISASHENLKDEENRLEEYTSLDTWIERRGLKNLSPPTRRDLKRMWSALQNIRDMNDLYESVAEENIHLKNLLAEMQEEEADLRAELEEAFEMVQIEQERSRDTSAKMAELAISMHEQFSLLEDERRQLQRDLEEARVALGKSVDGGAEIVLQELECLKEELERLRIAEAQAREEAEMARSKAQKLEQNHSNQESLHSPGLAVEGDNHDEDEHHEINIDSSGGVQRRVNYFEALNANDEAEIPDGDTQSPARNNAEDDVACQQPDETSPVSECPKTGIRAPNTTPVDMYDATTPQKIHIETMNQFRQTWTSEHAISEKEVEEVQVDQRESEAFEPSESESDFDIEEIKEIFVSPIDVEDLARVNLRQTVMDRIAAVKNDLASAKSRLNHAQCGFRHGKTKIGANKQNHAEKCGKDRLEVDVEHMPCADDGVGSTPDDKLTKIPATTPVSQRSIFARKIDLSSTPMSLRKTVFTPRTGSLSVAKSTAHISPRLSSAGSSSTPAPTTDLEPLTRPRRSRRLGHGVVRERSETEDKEFRRRAAALKIHVSPYFKKHVSRREMLLNQ